MNRLLRLVKRGKALRHIVMGKREALTGEQVVLEARASFRNLEWYLADNIADISVRRSKKARSLLSRVPR
jgi:surface antigen